MNSKPKIAIVAARFSDSISGGAEKHALKFALLMSEKYEVTVLTTTALDYKTWKNELPAGESNFQKIRVIRFPVDKPRELQKFNKFLDRIRQGKILWNDETSDLWLRKQGPASKKLIQFIEENQSLFNLFFFISYLYYPTVIGIKNIKSKSICLPTLHDEFPAYFPVYKKTFTNEISYCFNTIEELALFKHIFGFTPDKFSVIGVNIDLDDSDFSLRMPGKMGKYFLDQNPDNFTIKNYAVYIGRADGGKGVNELIEFFREWKKNYSSDLKLLFIGDDFCEEDDIISTGYLPVNEKNFLLKRAKFLINPSSLESFSMVIMEAWAKKIPVVVNEKSDVMKGHCIRSNGGLYYSDKESFFKILNYLLKNEMIRKGLGENGYKYVSRNYSTEIVRTKLFDLIESRI